MEPYRTAADLPETLPVFPLPGALLFPRWDLPLNIFEPRYLNMFDDAMRGHRLIGMIQSLGGPREKPQIARVGCAGRITRYGETDDGRYLVVLSGICRFSVTQELDVRTPYRQVRAGWAPHEGDLADPPEADLPDRPRLVRALRAYAAANALQADWSAVEAAPIETLVHALASGCPFTAPEKQVLLEAVSLADRAQALITLLEIGSLGDPPGPVQ